MRLTAAGCLPPVPVLVLLAAEPLAAPADAFATRVPFAPDGAFAPAVAAPPALAPAGAFLPAGAAGFLSLSSPVPATFAVLLEVGLTALLTVSLVSIGAIAAAGQAAGHSIALLVQ